MQAAHDNYLVNEVMTATPQKLQLMLIEAALRFGRQAQEHWKRGEEEQAGEAILRAQRIVAELLGGMNPERDPNLVRKVAGVYMYVFNELIHAHLNRNEKSLSDALSVLAIEQETWQQVCAQLGSNRSSDETRASMTLEA